MVHTTLPLSVLEPGWLVYTIKFDIDFSDAIWATESVEAIESWSASFDAQASYAALGFIPAYKT